MNPFRISLGTTPAETGYKLADKLDFGGALQGDVVDVLSVDAAVACPAALDETLQDAIDVISGKIDEGCFDSQSLPLVDALLDEIDELAKLQRQREAIRNERLNLAKTANGAAYNALCACRVAREEDIRQAFAGGQAS